LQKSILDLNHWSLEMRPNLKITSMRFARFSATLFRKKRYSPNTQKTFRSRVVKGYSNYLNELFNTCILFIIPYVLLFRCASYLTHHFVCQAPKTRLNLHQWISIPRASRYHQEQAHCQFRSSSNTKLHLNPSLTCNPTINYL
jgi:hypothetical protein